MSHEEIITGLRNGIDRGETLEIAKRIMINSGYNHDEVNEASNFVNQGVTSFLLPKPDEHLIMPEDKKAISKSPLKQPPEPPRLKPVNPPEPPIPSKMQEVNNQPLKNEHPNHIQDRPYVRDINRPINQPLKNEHPNHIQDRPYVNNINEPVQERKKLQAIQNDKLQTIRKEKPKQRKKSYLTEILLLIILLSLIGVLVVTVIYRNEILAFLTG